MLRRNSPVIKPNSQPEIYSQLKMLLKWLVQVMAILVRCSCWLS